MYILVDKTESEQGNGSAALYYKRLVDYGSRPFVDPNFKWLIACVPVLVVIVLVICLRARKARQRPKFAQEDQVQPESEFVNSPVSDTETSESQLDNQNARRLGPPNRTSGSFGQMLPLWNARSTSLSPICSVPPPAYVRDPPDPPKYEDIIGPDDVPLAHCASRLFRQAG
ncbi:hypothetical protein NQZ79_g7660 [Umbelopsis isabellina]|nr:hypothetical protein NQZ79_g7660 [Umbelopsis isabellina]